jgi:hypothetical protein
MKLRPEVKAEWLTRLRSGNYPQGTTYLRWKGKYCCLGVLCEIAQEQGATSDSETGNGSPSYFGPATGNGSRSAIWTPGDVVRWAFEDVPETLNADEFAWLITGPDDTGADIANLGQLNDRGETFEEIANIIDQNY